MATIKVKRGTSANLGLMELAAGEPGFTLDDGAFFIGDGVGKKLINSEPFRFAVCGTAAATVQKTVTLKQFKLEAGEWLFVSFSATNSAANPTLNVNGLGAKPIYYRNAAITAANLTNTRLYLFVYDGAQFELVGDIDTNTTYSAMSQAEADTGTATTARLLTAKVLADWLTGKTGSANGKLVAVGSDGKIDSSLIPQQAITDVFEASSQAAMLALAAHAGDVCIRSDTAQTYILKSNPATTLANWALLPIPSDLVLSVAGKTGAVTLTASDVGLGDDTLFGKVRSAVLTGLSTASSAAVTAADTVLVAIGKLQGQISKRAPLADPALTGVPTAPTAAAGTNTTQIATTAFVKNSIDVIDGGVF
jgi:hypothetical protein